MLFGRCRRRKKNGECSFLFSFNHKTEITHFFSPFREEERKSERHLSFFILSPTAGGMADLPPLSLKKEKRKRREAGRTQAEGRRTKAKRNGKKEKGERSERTKAGETATRHATERRIPDAGEQEKNRKRIPLSGDRKRG